MSKIRKAGKNSTTLEISLNPAMKADGFVEGAYADIEKINGTWQLLLRTPAPAKEEPKEQLVGDAAAFEAEKRLEETATRNKEGGRTSPNLDKEVEAKVSD